MGKIGWSVKLSSETRGRLDELMNRHGSGEELIEKMLSAYESLESASIDIPSRARPEVVTLAKRFQDCLDQVQSIVFLAESEREQAKEEIEGVRAKAREEQDSKHKTIKELRETIESDQAKITELQEQIQGLSESLKNAHAHSESIEELKAAWQEKEGSLHARINELVEEREKLKHFAQKNTDLKHQSDLKDKDITTYQNRLEELRQRWAEKEEGLKARIEEYKAQIPDIEALKSENSELKHRLELKRKDLDFANSKIEELQEAIKELRTATASDS